jgi:glycosyltransferase involved in cell wall biosynthesis
MTTGQNAARSRPLRVLFLNENLGGHATMHRAIRDAISAYPEVTATFVDVPSRRLVRRIAGAGIPPLDRLDLDFAALRSQLALSFVARRILREKVGTYDVLHVYTQHAALLSAGVLASAPTIVSTDATGVQVSGLLPYRLPTRWTPLQHRVRSPLEQRVYDSATLVVGKSQWCVASLRKDYRIPEERLRRIPFGVVVPPEAPRTPTPSGRPEITFVGTTLARKGGDRLLRVYRARLAERADLNLVTRENVPEQPGVRVFRDLAPGDPRLVEILSRTSVLAFPTEMDTFGYAALEAMAMAVPVVGSRLHALPEIVVDGSTGVLVEPDDRELAQALQRLSHDDALRRQMGKAARERVLAHFDAHSTTGALVDLLFEAHERYGSNSSRRS